MTARTLHIGGREYPVVLPKWKDPRLTISAVVLSVLFVGIAVLGFNVSIPQILTAMGTAIVIDGWKTYRETGKLVWPASGLNTATGIALIVRVVGTETGDLWSWHGWYIYAGTVALALFTKYFVGYRGEHIFNPSNFALVAMFLMLGSGRVEPLDLWWAPIGTSMVIVYLIILGGGLLTLARLKMIYIPVAFWVALAAGLGVLAASGHCISARWSLEPVCGVSYWWVVLTSPELLFFLFFMITDPKTIPRGRVARLVNSVIIGGAVTILVAPQTTEFATKVGLLAGLTVISPLRWALDRWFPKTESPQSSLSQFVSRLATDRGVAIGTSRLFRRGALGGGALAGVLLLVPVLGIPARPEVQVIPSSGPVVTVEVDPTALPVATVGEEVGALSSDFGSAQDLAVMLAENLAMEAEAMRRHQGEVLLAADFGPRLVDMQDRMVQSVATGEWSVDRYQFDALHLTTVTVAGGQGTDLAFEATGTVERTTYDADGAELHAVALPCASTFVLRLAPGEQWLILDEIVRS